MRKTLWAAVCVWAMGDALAVHGEQPAEVKAILDKAISAHGGRDNLGKYKAATWKIKGKFYGLGKGIDYGGTWAVHPPDRARIQVSSDFNNEKLHRILVINGDKGWVKMNGDTEDLDKEQLAEEKERLYASWLATLAPLLDDTFTLAYGGDRRVGAESAAVLTVTREGHRDVKLYFNMKTGLLLKSETQVKNLRSGRDATQEVFYTDYKEVDGLRRAMKVAIKWDNMLYADAQFSDFKPLETVDEKVFGKP